MSAILETILVWAERQLPEGKRIWISDLKSEAKHIPEGLARQRFLWSGTLAALGQVLRIRVGVQRVGQTLLGLALFTFCLGGLYMAPSIENAVVRMTFCGALPIYLVLGSLALLNISLMKRLTVCCILILGLFWLISGLEFFTSMDAPVYFFRAFAIETALIMTGLLIAASYLEWVESANHA